MLNECEQLWVSRAAQALDARLTNHVVAPSVNPALDVFFRVKVFRQKMHFLPKNFCPQEDV